MTSDARGEGLISQLPPQNFDLLYKLGQARLDYLISLNTTKDHIEELALVEGSVLPAEVEVGSPKGEREIRFRIWDEESWFEKHISAYAPELTEILTRTTFSSKNQQQLFFQLVNNDLFDELWFLTAVQQIARQGTTWLNPSVTVSCDDEASRLNRFHIPGLLAPSKPWNRFLTIARNTARKYRESDVLFCLEPLLCAAALGLFAFVSLRTGMSIDELLRITLDVFDWEIQSVSGSLVDGEPWIVFKVPKRSGKFQYYGATSEMLDVWRIVYSLHNHFCGDFEPLPAKNSFSKSVRRHTYLFQWAGVRLTSDDIKECMNFLFLENHPWDRTNYFYDITPFFLEEVAPGSPPADIFYKAIKFLDTKPGEQGIETTDWESFSPLPLD